MLYRSGDNLLNGVLKFIDDSKSLTLFSAYLQLEQLKKINVQNKISNIVVRWEIKDLCLNVSNIELYDYCDKNKIALYRNTRLHMKVFWDNSKSILYGSANVTGRGVGEEGNTYNFELNGSNTDISFDDQSYLNKVLLESEYVTKELYNEIKKKVGEVELPVIDYPKLPTPPPTVDYFLINQLPMTSTPELLYDIYTGQPSNDLEISCAAHDFELYKIKKGLNREEFFNHLKNTFNSHPFILKFKD